MKATSNKLAGVILEMTNFGIDLRAGKEEATNPVRALRFLRGIHTDMVMIELVLRNDADFADLLTAIAIDDAITRLHEAHRAGTINVNDLDRELTNIISQLIGLKEAIDTHTDAGNAHISRAAITDAEKRLARQDEHPGLA